MEGMPAACGCVTRSHSPTKTDLFGIVQNLDDQRVDGWADQHPQPQADDLHGRDRLPLRDSLPHWRHSPAHRQAVGVGSGEGTWIMKIQAELTRTLPLGSEVEVCEVPWRGWHPAAIQE
jgi:hypothetical protein